MLEIARDVQIATQNSRDLLLQSEAHCAEQHFYGGCFTGTARRPAHGAFWHQSATSPEEVAGCFTTGLLPGYGKPILEFRETAVYIKI